jgi:hypothetical protein
MNGDNRYVAMLNSDSDRRILDNNWFDNEWNSDNRFLFVRKSLHVFATPSSISRWRGLFLFTS